MASFAWLAQPIGWLPEALRPGVFIALVVLLVWFIFVRRGVLDLWRATCRGLAHLLDLCMGAVLRFEYTITTARRRRGQAPPQWAFAFGGVADVVQDGAAWLYEHHRPRAAQSVEQDDEQEVSKPAPPRHKPSVPWLLCTFIVVCCTAAWIAMDQLPAASIAKYRLAQVSDPWRDFEEWVGVDSGRGVPPKLVRVRRHHELMNIRVDCAGPAQCLGWLLLSGRSEAIVVARYVDLTPGSTVVSLRLTHEQLDNARGGHLVVAQI